MSLYASQSLQTTFLRLRADQAVRKGTAKGKKKRAWLELDDTIQQKQKHRKQLRPLKYIYTKHGPDGEAEALKT